MEPTLVFLSGPREGQSYALQGAELSLGRHPSNAVELADLAVSRRHALFVLGEEGVLLRDLDSRHGITVGRERIQERRLVHGDRFVIGSSEILFLSSSVQVAPEESVVFDGSTPSADSTLALEAADGYYFRPERVLAEPDTASANSRIASLLLRAGASMASFTDLETLAEGLLSWALEAVPAERAALLLTSSEEGQLAPVFTRVGPTGGDTSSTTGETFTVSRTTTLRVLSTQEALLSNRILQTGDLGDAESLASARVASLLAVPLLLSTASDPQPRVLGVLYLDNRHEETPFLEDHLRLLTALAGMAAPAISNLQHLAWIDGERRRLLSESLDHDLVGESEPMARALSLIARVASSETSVLLRGESGTGKELAARALHRGGERRDRPFVAINCATLTGSLLESELFGHEKGAFTGAAARKAGKLEIAHSGTLFLDEVAELPLPTQAKLLRVLQEREFERVGGTRPIRVDVRLIAATHRDLEAAIEEGQFRQDLYYRLNVVAVTLPPLRERHGDIPLLANHFAELHAARLKRSAPGFSTAARRLLESHPWPGNVRELSNAIERALVLSTDEVVRPEDLPEALLEGASSDALESADGYQATLLATKRRLIVDAVRAADGNITRAAAQLGLHPNYLHRLIRQLDLRSRLKS